MNPLRVALIFSILGPACSTDPALPSDVTETSAANGSTKVETTTQTASTGGGSGGETGQPEIVDKAGPCVGEFGDALTSSFGRLDGTIIAALRPTDMQCPRPNDDHVILEVEMNGEAYRMVVNVKSNYGDPRVWWLMLPHALPDPAWDEGWHPAVHLDYWDDLGAASDAFTQYEMNDLSERIVAEITLGQRVSVYAESSGGDSAHKVHRTTGSRDGAIVLDPESDDSRVLLFHFDNQVFP